DHFGEVAAALFGKRGHGHADGVAHAHGVEPEIRFANGLLDDLGHGLFVGLHADGARIDQVHVGDLAHGHLGTVVFDLDVVQDARVRTPRADLGQVDLQRLQRLGHTGFGGFTDFCDAHEDFLCLNVYQRAFVFAADGALARPRLRSEE